MTRVYLNAATVPIGQSSLEHTCGMPFTCSHSKHLLFFRLKRASATLIEACVCCLAMLVHVVTEALDTQLITTKHSVHVDIYWSCSTPDAYSNLSSWCCCILKLSVAASCQLPCAQPDLHADSLTCLLQAETSDAQPMETDKDATAAAGSDATASAETTEEVVKKRRQKKTDLPIQVQMPGWDQAQVKASIHDHVRCRCRLPCMCPGVARRTALHEPRSCIMLLALYIQIHKRC